MKLYAGLDVSLETTSLCVVDEDGRIRLEARCLSEPAALIPVLEKAGREFVRIGLEAGPLSQWLYFGLVGAGLLAAACEGGNRRDDDEQERPERCALDCAGGAVGLVQGGARQDR